MKRNFRVAAQAIRRLGAVCLLIGAICALLSMLSACGECAPEPTAFAARDFSAELRGRMTSPEVGEVTEFTVKVEVRTAGDARAVRVTHLAPDRLEGLEIEAILTADGLLAGEATVRIGGLCIPTDADRVSGLLSPVSVLLSPRELASIRATDAGWEATYGDGARIHTDASGRPLAFFSPEISFDVVWYDARGAE